MSFLKDFYRQKSLEIREKGTQVGRFCVDGKFSSSGCRYELNDIDQNRSAHFFKVMDQLFSKLAYAELASDYPEFQKATSRRIWHPLIAVNDNSLYFLLKRSSIYEKLRQEFQGNSEQDVRDWFRINEELLVGFLKDLDAIYASRNTSTKRKDISWEIADCVVAALLITGAAAAVIYLAGPAIFRGAFVHLVAPVATATMSEWIGVGAGLAGAVGLFKCLNTEKRQIINAIKKDLRATAQANSGWAASQL